MQWCRPSPKKNSSHTLSLQWCQVSHFLTPFPGRRRGEKYFERVETGTFHTLFASQYFSPLSKTVEYLFQGVGTEDFHTFFASQLFFTPFSWIVLQFSRG